MNPLRQRIVDEALTWVKTPYVDHAGVKGAGVDCAHLPLRVYQAVGLIPYDFVAPHYTPQQWLKHKTRDTAFEDIVLDWAEREITEEEVQPGDFVLYKIVNSWTHGAIVINWPHFLLHPIVGQGVVGSTSEEGFLRRRQRRFVNLLED